MVIPSCQAEIGGSRKVGCSNRFMIDESRPTDEESWSTCEVEHIVRLFYRSSFSALSNMSNLFQTIENAIDWLPRHLHNVSSVTITIEYDGQKKVIDCNSLKPYQKDMIWPGIVDNLNSR